MPDNKFPMNGTNQEKFVYVYKKAKEYGDPFPELVAAQFALESAYGTSEHTKNFNNPFGQTEVGDTLQKRKWKKFDSVDSAIKYRVNKWGAKYKDAKNPISAMAKIQGSYAPSNDGNSGYMKSIASILKSNDFYKGDINIPNADKSPDFYKERNNADFTIDKKLIEQKLNEYDSEIEKIKSSKEPDIIKADELTKLQIKYQDQGYILPNDSDGNPQGFNLIIAERNKAKEEKVNDLVSLTKKNLNVNYDIKKDAKGNEIQVLNKKQDKRLPYSNSSYYSKTYAGVELTKEEYEKLKKKYPSLVTKNDNFSQIDGDYLVNLEELDSNLFKETGVKLFNEVQFNRGNHKTTQFIRNKNQKIDVNVGSTLKNKFGTTTNLGGVFSFGEVNVPTNKITRSPLGYIQDSEESTEEEVTDTEETKPVDSTNATTRELSSPSQREEQKTEETLASDDFFRNDMEVPEGIDSQDFKDNFPFAEVLGNAAGAVIGLGMADKKIPMRDEMVSGAFLNYAAELKKLSEIGLRPEEEAYAKRMLTESYSGSIDQIVKASGGNRNLVLGNLGRVDAQKNMSLIQLAVADASAKTDALHKYGEATKYINEFDARRDIANNERKYKDVLMTKEAGAQLAQASFAGIVDSIQNYQDNKPGSANHLYRSHMYRELLGYDPQLKDDGSGNQKWTFSWMKKNNEKLIENAKEHNEIAKTYWGMTHEERKMMNQFMVDNNFKDYGKFAEEVIAQRDKGSKFSPEGMDEFKRTGNTSSLFLGQNEVYLDPNTMFADEKVNAESGRIANTGVQQYTKDEIANDNIKNENLLIEEHQDSTNEVVNPIQGGYNLDIFEANNKQTYDSGLPVKTTPNDAYESAKSSFIKRGGNEKEFYSEEEFAKMFSEQF